MNREAICEAVAAHYSAKFNGKVWCLWDDDVGKYCIRGEGLPPAPELAATYPNGWSLLDHLSPSKALKIAGKTGDGKATGRPKGTRNASAPGLLIRLSQARAAAGVSQADAARLIGKTPSHFSKIERGVIGLDARHALILCNRLGLTLAELLETAK